MWEKYWDFGFGRKRTHMCAFFVGIALCYFSGLVANAQVLTPDFEIKRIANVGAGWQTITLENTYAQAIPICTYNLPSSSSPPATTRIRNITSTSFELRIQQFESNDTVTASDVHCIIADEGAYTAGGLKFEARSVLSNGTSRQGNWGIATTEDVTFNVTQSYASPVVFGQVMSFNDVRASVFWSFNCASRGSPPFIGNTRICVGKHTGQIKTARADEMVGYIVAEAGSGMQNDVAYALALGARAIAGVGNSPPYTYGVTNDYDIGVLSQSAMNGAQGGWPVLYGNNPLPANTISLAIEEEIVSGDKSRGHTNENVAYWVFKDNQTASLSSSKIVQMAGISASPYSIPGSDLIYTIEVANLGSKPVDPDSILIIDALPEETVFYNGDIDNGGPEVGSVTFNSTGSGLVFSETTDLAFSNALTKPAQFSGCNYTPSSGYDTNVNFICLNPKGKLNAGSLAMSKFSIKFRALIK